jgi:hypothetical protein
MKEMKITYGRMYQIKMTIYLQNYWLIRLHKLVNLYHKIIKKMIKFKTKIKTLMMIISNCNIRGSVKFFTIVLIVNMMTVTKKNFRLLKESKVMHNLNLVLLQCGNKNNPKILAVHFNKIHKITKKKVLMKV